MIYVTNSDSRYLIGLEYFNDLLSSSDMNYVYKNLERFAAQFAAVYLSHVYLCLLVTWRNYKTRNGLQVVY